MWRFRGRPKTKKESKVLNRAPVERWTDEHIAALIEDDFRTLFAICDRMRAL